MLAMFLIQVDQNLGVAGSLQMMAFAFELPAQFLVVVNFSIEGYLDGLIFIAQRLGSACEIDDAEAAVTESDIRVEEGAVAIGPRDG